MILSCDVCVDECGVASRLLWRGGFESPLGSRRQSLLYTYFNDGELSLLFAASTLCIPRHLRWREYIWLWLSLQALMILSCDVCVDECGVASRLLWR